MRINARFALCTLVILRRNLPLVSMVGTLESGEADARCSSWQLPLARRGESGKKRLPEVGTLWPPSKTADLALIVSARSAISLAIQTVGRALPV